MNDTLTAARTATTPLAAVPQGPRVDLYTAIHKALRLYMGSTLAQLGSMDIDDADERQRTLDGVDRLLATLRGHLQHENEFVHTAIEARRPGGARDTASDHRGHLEAISNLEDEVGALRTAADGRRAAQALALYRHLAAFVGENLEHMQVEETVNNAALWALYSDDELAALHDRLVASIDPAEMAQIAGWMGAALSPAELIAMLQDMQRKAPPEAVAALLGMVRPRLSEQRWARLARALGVPPVPGLVTV